MKKIIFTNKYGNRFGLENIELADAIEKLRPSIGLDARWLPEFLEGAETRQVELAPAYPEVLEHTEVIGEVETYIPYQPAQEAVYETQYLHPAEYTYEIIEETLDQIKARKLKWLSEESLRMRELSPYGEEYRVANSALGIYDTATIAKVKEVHLRFRNNFYRLVNVVNACNTEAEVNDIQFTLE